MAPVAGAVADTDNDGLVFGFGPVQRFFAPWLPVHRIVSVLEQVGARFVDEGVGMFMLRNGGSVIWSEW